MQAVSRTPVPSLGSEGQAADYPFSRNPSVPVLSLWPYRTLMISMDLCWSSQRRSLKWREDPQKSIDCKGDKMLILCDYIRTVSFSRVSEFQVHKPSGSTGLCRRLSQPHAVASWAYSPQAHCLAIWHDCTHEFPIPRGIQEHGKNVVVLTRSRVE